MKEENKTFLEKLLTVGKIMAIKSKDPKICNAIKKRANY